jgi:CMP-N,N'-diacetyllegionaminic acid synthase
LKPICIIAARGGSKGVKNKNSRIIAGNPLISHTIKKAIDSKIFQHVIVSSEDSKIIRYY